MKQSTSSWITPHAIGGGHLSESVNRMRVNVRDRWRTVIRNRESLGRQTAPFHFPMQNRPNT